MGDENDIVYNTYGFDLVAIIRDYLERTFFSGTGESIISGGMLDTVLETLSFWWNIYSLVAILLSLIFFIGFVYARIRYGQLSEFHSEQLKKAEEEWARKYGGVTGDNKRWSSVQEHIKSENPSDWRLAIIEADILLEDTLEEAGYSGTTIGEKLKTANPMSFTTVQDAWDAHKVRNEIAHAGNDFVLTKRLATETILKYERVFREFKVI